MKKYILILIALVCFAPGLLAQINCCPEFSLKFDKDATQCCNPKCMENGKVVCANIVPIHF